MLFAQAPTPQILLAEDHPLVREGIALLMQQFWPSCQIHHAGDREQIVLALTQLPVVDLMVIDWHMPGIERLRGWRPLLDLRNEVPVVVVSADTGPNVRREAETLHSVYAFVPKSAGTEQLRLALEAAFRHERLRVSKTEAAPSMLPETSTEQAQTLSPRLLEIQQLLRKGMSNKHIARELNISTGTVRNYLSEIYRQLGVDNRTQAAFFDPQEPKE